MIKKKKSTDFVKRESAWEKATEGNRWRKWKAHIFSLEGYKHDWSQST